MFAFDADGESPRICHKLKYTVGNEKSVSIDNENQEYRREIFEDYKRNLCYNQKSPYVTSIPTTITVVLNDEISGSIHGTSERSRNGTLGRCNSLYAILDQMTNQSTYKAMTTTSLDKMGTDITIDDRIVSTDASWTASDSSALDNKSDHNQSTFDDDNFVQQMFRYLGNSRDSPNFEDYGGIRNVMEPFLRKARLARRDATNEALGGLIHHSSTRHLGHPIIHYTDVIGSSVGVPYSALRQERPFLFNEHTHPLHTLLAQTLNVADLSLLHLSYNTKDFNQHRLLSPLLDQRRRYQFHSAFDSFVTSHCVPLLHSLAINNNVFNHSNGGASNDGRITYRYQGFPTIQVVRPGESDNNVAPTCDVIDDYSIGCLMFYIPLTPTDGTNCMYVESYPGRENWHPLKAKSVGLGYLFDGARCLRFGLKNTTDCTRVSLIFRVVIYRDQSREIPSLERILHVSAPRALSSNQLDQQVDELFGVPSTVIDDNSDLCPLILLEDKYSLAGPGYYDEVIIDVESRQKLQLSSVPSLTSFHNAGLSNISVKRNGSRLIEPDYRSGHPFTHTATNIE